MLALLPASSEPLALSNAIRISQGRISIAERLLQNSFESYHDESKSALTFLSSTALEKMLNLAPHADEKKYDPITPLVREKRKDALSLIAALESIVRDVLLASASPHLCVHLDYQSEIGALAKRYSKKTLFSMLRLLREIRYTIERNGNIQLAFEYFTLVHKKL